MSGTPVVGMWRVFADSLVPPSNDLSAMSVLSKTRKDGSAEATFSRLPAVDLRLPKVTGNLGMENECLALCTRGMEIGVEGCALDRSRLEGCKVVLNKRVDVDVACHEYGD